MTSLFSDTPDYVVYVAPHTLRIRSTTDGVTVPLRGALIETVRRELRIEQTDCNIPASSIRRLLAPRRAVAMSNSF